MNHSCLSYQVANAHLHITSFYQGELEYKRLKIVKIMLKKNSNFFLQNAVSKFSQMVNPCLDYI